MTGGVYWGVLHKEMEIVNKVVTALPKRKTEILVVDAFLKGCKDKSGALGSMN